MQEKAESPREFRSPSVAPVEKVVDLQSFREERDLRARLRLLERENRYLNSICTNLIVAIEGLRQRSRSQ